jgi:hypothetical protein
MTDQLIIGMKRNDLLPVFRVRLTDANNPGGVDLSAATEVRLLMANLAGLKVNHVMVVEDQTQPATLGVVHYEWTGTDTDTSGDFNAEIQVTWPGALPQTWPVSTDPAPDYMIVRIQKDLGP